MFDCRKCGANDWGWSCQGGIMKGKCKKCGELTNEFRAHQGTKYDKTKAIIADAKEVIEKERNDITKW